MALPRRGGGGGLGAHKGHAGGSVCASANNARDSILHVGVHGILLSLVRPQTKMCGPLGAFCTNRSVAV